MMPRYIDQDRLINRLKEHCATIVKKRWFDDYVRGYGDAISDWKNVGGLKHGI